MNIWNRLRAASFSWARLVAVGAFSLLAGPALAQSADDLTVNLGSRLTTFVAGAVAEYDLRVSNSGNVGSDPATLELTIPENTEFVGVSGLTCAPENAPAESDPFTVTCEIPALAEADADGDEIQASVNLRHLVAGSVDLLAGIVDGKPQVSVTRTVLSGADLALELTADPETIQSGNVGAFAATITNNGPYASEGAQLRVTIPAGMAPAFDMPDACSVSGQVLTCDVGALPVGAVKTFEFKSQATAADASAVTMSASLTGGTPADSDSGNNNANADLAIEEGTDLGLTKQRAPGGLLVVGDPVTFTLNPRYIGTMPGEARITDSVPPNYTVQNVAGSDGWTCGFTGQEVICDFTGGAWTDATEIVIETVAAQATGVSGVENQAEIQSDDENTGAPRDNNIASDGRADIVEPYVDLEAHKSGPAFPGDILDGPLVVVGEEYDFTLSATNTGTTGFSGPLTITDHLPAGLEVTAIDAPAGWVCPTVLPIIGGDDVDIVCVTDIYTEGAPLEPGASTGAIVLTAEVTATGAISNGMTVSFPGYEEEDGDAEPLDNTTYTGVTSGEQQASADVSVSKTRINGSGAVNSGEAVSFRIEIANAGPTAAENVIMLDRLDPIVAPNGGEPDAEDVSYSLDAQGTGLTCRVDDLGSYAANLVCEIPVLEPCGGATGLTCPAVTVTIYPGEDGTHTNTAYAYSTVTPDENTGNNESSANATVEPRTDVTVHKTSTAADATIPAGQQLTYDIAAEVLPNGLSGAENVIITDTLPDNVRFISVNARDRSCSVTPDIGEIVSAAEGNNIVQCELGDIGNGSQRVVTIVVVPLTTLVGQDIENSVMVETDTPETDTDNNDASVTVSIAQPVLDLIIDKVDTIDPVEIFTDTAYTIRLQNLGPSDATDVVVTDTLPAIGLADPRLPAVLPEGWDCELAGHSEDDPGGTLTCDIAYFPAGAEAELTLTMEAVAARTHTNNVEVTSAETAYEAITANNRSDETTTVRYRSDIGVVKQALAADLSGPVGVVDLRETFAWQMVVTAEARAGLDLAEGVTLTDTLLDNMELTAPPAGLGMGTEPVQTDQGACALNGREISCELGDIAPGASVTVTAWVKVISTVPGQAITNEVSVETLSFDHERENNTDEATVATVRAGVVSGSIWWDFDEDDTQNTPGDIGIGNITVRLDGTAEHDREPITAETVTDSGGDYSFENVPPGTYSVSYVYDAASLPRSEQGSALPGDDNADPGELLTAPNSATIGNIIVVQNGDSGNHDFTLIPQASVTIEKTVAPGVPAFNADGSYNFDYTLTVTNPSMEPLEQIDITDTFDASFGTPVAGTPGIGQYAVTGIASSFGGAQAGFTGRTGTDLIVEDGGPLADGANGTVTYTVRVNPTVPRPQPLEHGNDVEIVAVGAWSGQDSTTNDGLTDEDDATVTPAFAAAIELTKVADLADENGDPLPAGTAAAEGDRINYTFTIENTGNTPLVDVELSDPLPGLQGPAQTAFADLDPGQEATTTAYYVLTQDDIDNGQVDNSASVEGRWATGDDGVVEDDDSVTVEALAEPALTIVKSIVEVDTDVGGPDDPTEAGVDTITYQFVVTNTGNTTLRDVVVIDDKLDADINVGDLPVGEDRTVQGTYTVTQADIDAGEVINTAFARGTSGPDGSTTTVDSPDDDATQPLYQNPALTLVKAVGDAPEFPRDGEDITWTVTATNTGNVTLTGLVLSDDDVAPVTITPANVGSLAPGDQAVFTVTHALTQDEIDAGFIDNQATLAYVPPGGDPLEPEEIDSTPPDDDEPGPTRTDLGQQAGISLEKTAADPVDPVTDETVIHYTFTIGNTGNVTLTGLTLEDQLEDAGFALDAGERARLDAAELLPGAELEVTGSYTLKQADIDHGSITNEATVTGTPPEDYEGDDPEADDAVTTTFDQEVAVDLLKEPGTVSQLTDLPRAGDRVTWTITATNTGNVTLTDLELSDDTADPNGITAVTDLSNGLAPGDQAVFTVTHTLTQEEIDAGGIDNLASFSYVPPGGDPDDPEEVESHPDGEDPGTPTVTDIEQDAAITLEKVADPIDGDPVAGETVVRYTFTITNPGNVTLAGLELADELADAGFTLDQQSLDDLAAAELAPQNVEDRANANALAELVLTGSYTLTQDDIDSGSLTNTATVTGTPPEDYDGDDPEATDAVTTPLGQGPSIELVKDVGTVSTPLDPRAGDSVTWTITATNNGNVRLNNLELSDPLADQPGGIVNVDVPVVLEPNDTATFTVTHTLTQDEIDAGFIDNRASLQSDTPNNTPFGPILSTPPSPDDEGEPGKTRTPLVQNAEITLEKTAAAAVADPVAGETEIAYTFTITNPGNVTLTGLELADELADAGFALDQQSLDDLAAAELAPQNAEDKADGEALTELVLTGSYVLTQDDIDSGSVTNHATVTGTPPEGYDGDDPEADDAVTTTLEPSPEADLVKDVDNVPAAPRAGDTITWTVMVTNTGNVTLTNLELTDTLADTDGIAAPALPDGLAPEASATFTVTHTLTQDEIDAGRIDNLAMLAFVPPGGDPEDPIEIESRPPAPGSQPGDPTPADLPTSAGIAILKEVDAEATHLSSPSQVGDRIGYSFTLTNTGTLTLRDVAVSDMLPGIALENGGVLVDPLLPGAENAVTITGTYLVTQADIQRGHVDNRASAEGHYKDPADNLTDKTTSGDSELLTVDLERDTSLTIVKTAEPEALPDPTPVGTVITYTFTVTNTGNLDLDNVVIEDPLDGLDFDPADFAIGKLGPGEVVSRQATYTIGADDIGANGAVTQIENTASVGGEFHEDPNAPPVPVSPVPSDPVVRDVMPPLPGLSIEKVATFLGGADYALVGDKIAYTFTITNTGNVPVEDVTPQEVEGGFTFGGQVATNSLSGFSPAPVTLDVGQTQVFTATYEISQDDLNAAAAIHDGVSNSATAMGMAKGTVVDTPIVSDPSTATLTLLPQPPSDVTITKSTRRPTIHRGETVPFAISVVNNSLADAGKVTIVDRIPSGFAFVADSASVNGAAFAPRVDGNELVFEDIHLAPKATIEISLVLQALPATPPGRYVNHAFGYDALGGTLAAPAEAHVEILAEAVFDCSDVIGTVFNDLDGNGYQDQGEPGIPAVRLATVRGTLVTADAFGRFSIPCAALPDGGIGSNFVLKIDERTLPAGFTLTTDNPAMVRLTAGKMVEVNFGVALGREIALTISDDAFEADAAVITGDMSSGLDQLVAVLAEKPSRLKVTLETRKGELARDRLAGVVEMIRQRWRRAGTPYVLDIQTTIIER